MVIKNLYKKVSWKTILLQAVLALSLTACTDLVYEDEGECTVTYNLRFVYNMNLKWADAFPSEVHSVHLYAFDRDGLFVKDFIVNGEAVDQEGYTMRLDLGPGKYTLVAWCGMDNEGVAEKSFTVPVPVAGRTRIEELTCSLNVESDSQSSLYSDARLDFLYHGILKVDLPDVYNGSFDYTMYLTKNTNHIRIILQQLSAEDMNPEDFEFKIEDANGIMGYDNRMLGTDPITYLPWGIGTGEAGIDPNEAPDNGLVYADALIADFSTGRLIADHDKDLMLTITSKDKIVARVPILQYALMSKEYYIMAYGHEMSDQEFLDREDEYVFTFFLDDSQRWTEMHINILSWRMVVHNYDM